MQLNPLCIVPLLCAAVLGAPFDLHVAQNFTLDPYCDVMDDYNLIGCFLIDAGSTEVLIDALDNSTSWDEISLLLAFSAVNELPVDLLASSQLASLAFDLNCTLDGVPSALLAQISSPLRDLQFVNVLGLNGVSAGDLDGTGFSETLENLVFQSKELSAIESAAFQEFTHLKTLTVSGTSVTTLQAGTLLGLADLEEVTVTYNPVTSIPSGFFAGQGRIRNVWLGQNQLTTLEAGSLDGLDGVVMLNVAGNPFNCDCTLQWFKDWLTVRDLLDASGATCATPIAGKFSEVDFCA